MLIYEPSIGCSITDEVVNLVRMAVAEKTPVQMTFNGITVIAQPTSTYDELHADWHRQMMKGIKDYEASPEGKLAAKVTADRVVSDQAKVDALMAQLNDLDFSDMTTLINWMADLAIPADHIHVKLDNYKIIDKFVANGYTRNENTGNKFNGEDRENFARYIIGQGLNCLQGSVGRIHPLLIHFADEWRNKFKISV